LDAGYRIGDASPVLPNGHHARVKGE
jgi:hypothetical protein